MSDLNDSLDGEKPVDNEDAAGIEPTADEVAGQEAAGPEGSVTAEADAEDADLFDEPADEAPVAPDFPAVPADGTAVSPAVPSADEKPLARQSVKLPVFIAVAVACLAVGLAVGHFAFGPKSISLSGKTSLTSDEIDTTVASYTYNGKTTEISARDVITQSSTLESAANDDGTYSVPTATDIVTYARTKVVCDAGEAQGITVSDDEVNEYAEQKFSTSDFSTIATTYSIDEDVAKSMIKDSCLMTKMREQAVTTELPTQPTAPTAPSDDATDTPTAEYASYIIELAGDEWDSENNTWARTDGDYYAALSTYEISNDSATYAAAQAAYYVAYSAYSTAYSQTSTEWSEYCNTILSNASLTLAGMNV